MTVGQNAFRLVRRHKRAVKGKGPPTAMRYSDLAGKEIIDIDEGARIGVISETDLIIDCERGTVRSIIIPTRGRFWGRRELVIPWTGIKKIGVDLIIVDMSKVEPTGRGYWDPE